MADIEYGLNFQLTGASSVVIVKDRTGRITIDSNYVSDDQLNLLFTTFNQIVSMQKKKKK